MPPKDKTKNNRVKEDVRKMEESHDSSKITSSLSQSMLPSKTKEEVKFPPNQSIFSTSSSGPTYAPTQPIAPENRELRRRFVLF